MAPLPRPSVCFLPSAGAGRWNNQRRKIDGFKRCIAENDVALERYLAQRRRLRFQPLPNVDWANPMEIESKTLAAIEGGNSGFLFVLLHGTAYGGLMSWTYTSQDHRIRFHRIQDRYDVQRSSASPDKFIRYYDVVGEGEGVNRDDARWLCFRVARDRDGIWGITLLGFASRPYGQTQPSESQPFVRASTHSLGNATTITTRSP